MPQWCISYKDLLSVTTCTLKAEAPHALLLFRVCCCLYVYSRDVSTCHDSCWSSLSYSPDEFPLTRAWWTDILLWHSQFSYILHTKIYQRHGDTSMHSLNAKVGHRHNRHFNLLSVEALQMHSNLGCVAPSMWKLTQTTDRHSSMWLSKGPVLGY